LTAHSNSLDTSNVKGSLLIIICTAEEDEIRFKYFFKILKQECLFLKREAVNKFPFLIFICPCLLPRSKCVSILKDETVLSERDLVYNLKSAYLLFSWLLLLSSLTPHLTFTHAYNAHTYSLSPVVSGYRYILPTQYTLSPEFIKRASVLSTSYTAFKYDTWFLNVHEYKGHVYAN